MSRGHADIRRYSSEFKVLGSTRLVDARDHTATTYTATDRGVPIFYLSGAKIADDYADFYDGSWDSHSPTDESGNASSADRVWTGTKSDGTKYDETVQNNGWLGSRPNVMAGNPMSFD